MFGERLKELRKNFQSKEKKGMTQEDLGTLLNVASTTISNWENNITQPPFEVLKKIAYIFNVTADYLLGFSQEDYEKMEKLKVVLKEAGFIIDEDLTQEELQKALDIVEMLKEKK